MSAAAEQTMEDVASPAAAAAAASGAAAPAAAAAASSGKGKGAGKGSKRKAEDASTEIDPNFEGQRFKLGELIYANYVSCVAKQRVRQAMLQTALFAVHSRLPSLFDVADRLRANNGSRRKCSRWRSAED